MKGHNLLVVQGGGPTQVLNASLAGIVQEAQGDGGIGEIWGARAGIEGLVDGYFANLGSLSSSELELLRMSPGAALGSSRARPPEEKLSRIVENLRRRDVRYVLFIGGNGTMRGAERVGEYCRESGYDVQVIGIPKTVDNDIAITDRCPGYASAARFVADATRDLGRDVRSLPQPVSILETMGRDVGWLAAASVAGKTDPQDAPHLVYVPEIPFNTERFLSDLDGFMARLGWAIVVVSEGIRDETGRLVYQSDDPTQADALKRPITGGVAQFLAETVARRLKIRCRSEKPGLIGRASMLHAAAQDLKDAELVGRAGVRALLAGESDKMVSLVPLRANHGAGYGYVPLKAVAGIDRPLPAGWISESAIPVNDKFLEYLRPLIGELAPYNSPLQFQPDTIGDS